MIVKTEVDADLSCRDVEGGTKEAKTNGEIETAPPQTNYTETGVGVKSGDSCKSGAAPGLCPQPSRAVVAAVSGGGAGGEVSAKVSPIRSEGHHCVAQENITYFAISPHQGIE